jgi:hypothetical protein
MWAALVAEYPEWEKHFNTNGGGDLEVAVPAPKGSNAGHLVIFTNNDDFWVRYSPSHMCYALDDAKEMLKIIRQLLADHAFFIVIMDGKEWAETTLITPEQELHLTAGQVAHVVSWSGVHDRIIRA